MSESFLAVSAIRGKDLHAAERRRRLPKPAHLVKAELGIVLKGERHVLLISCADDIERTVRSWCAERRLHERARAEITAELQIRLDAAVAQAWEQMQLFPSWEPSYIRYLRSPSLRHSMRGTARRRAYAGSGARCGPTPTMGVVGCDR